MDVKGPERFKPQRLEELLRELPAHRLPTLIFCNGRLNAQRLYERFVLEDEQNLAHRRGHLRVALLHGECSAEQRQRILAAFSSDDHAKRHIDHLICTDVLARGVDFQRTSTTNFDLCCRCADGRPV